MKTQTFHSDLDLMFKIHPSKKDLVLSINEKAVIRSVKNLVLTNHYERLFQSEIGSNVSKMLFEPMTSITANIVQREIYDVITIFEPRVSNLTVDVKMNPDENSLTATVQFYLENSITPVSVDLLLERIR